MYSIASGAVTPVCAPIDLPWQQQQTKSFYVLEILPECYCSMQLLSCVVSYAVQSTGIYVGHGKTYSILVLENYGGNTTKY
jgi:hypothetical protein